MATITAPTGPLGNITGIGAGTSGALTSTTAPLAGTGAPLTGLQTPIGIADAAVNPADLQVGSQGGLGQNQGQGGQLGETPDQIRSSNLQFAAINDALANTENFANQQLSLYEHGQLPPGEQAAIDLSARSGLGSLSGQLAQEGIDPASSSQFAGGAENIALQKSTATEQALQQVLQNYFTAQGMQMQATEILGQFNQFDQTLALQYAQLALQAQEFQQQEKQQQKAQMGQMAGSAGGLLGKMKMLLAANMAIVHELMVRAGG
jgi:hypothetical protein